MFGLDYCKLNDTPWKLAFDGINIEFVINDGKVLTKEGTNQYKKKIHVKEIEEQNEPSDTVEDIEEK